MLALLHLPATTRLPSYSTFRRVLQSVAFTAFVEVFNTWAAQQLPLEKGAWVAADGKSIKSTFTQATPSEQNFLSQVSLYSHAHGWVAKTELMHNKHESEIAVVRRLIEAFQHAEIIFTLDALHTQNPTVKAIRHGNNDYVITLKANQPTLYRAAQQAHQNDTALSYAHHTDHSHNRIVERQVWVYATPAHLRRYWQGLTSLIWVKRHGSRNGQPFEQQHCYISSLALSAAEFLQHIRAHWGIENRLHWVKDTHFQEDWQPRQGGNAPIHWAILHTFFISIARWLGYRTIPQAQRLLANQLHQVFHLLV